MQAANDEERVVVSVHGVWLARVVKLEQAWIFNLVFYDGFYFIPSGNQ